MEEGIKYDQEKDRWDLLPIDALEEIVKVYTMGAKKYDDRNWEKGIKYSRIIGAIFRHITSWIMGETFDKESGLHHLAHAAWGCLAIIAFQKRGKEEFNDIQSVKETITTKDYFTNRRLPDVSWCSQCESLHNPTDYSACKKLKGDYKWFTFQNKK